MTASADSFQWKRRDPRKIWLCDIPDCINDPDEIDERIITAAKQMYIDLECYNIEVSDKTRIIPDGLSVWVVRRMVVDVIKSL